MVVPASRLWYTFRMKAMHLLACVLVGAVFAGEPTWILNHGPDAERVRVGQGIGADAPGLFRMRATGTDLTLSLPMSASDAFPAAARPFFALRYRNTSKWIQAGLFFTTDALTELSDKSYSPFPVICDGTWRNTILDMRAFKHGQWKGTITSFRLDPTNPSSPDDHAEVSRLGFFPSRETAAAFLAQADDHEDFSRELFLSGSRFRVLVPAHTLTPGWSAADYALARGQSLPLPPAGEGAFTVCRDGAPIPCKVNARGFAWYVADKPGRYTLARGQSLPLPAATARKLGCRISPKAKPAEFFTRDRIRIAGWGLVRNNKWSRRLVDDFAACGFDLLIADGVASGTHSTELLDACDENGVEVYLNDGFDPSKPELAGLAHTEHPSYCGHYLTDEPGTDAFAHWGKAARACAAATGKTPFINLLPMYANAAQLKFGAQAAAIEYYDPDPNLYRKYCEAYCDQVPTSYICTDIYPLNWDKNGHPTTYANYIESINVIASVARARNREFWCCIQTFGWTPRKRTPNAAEFRWQSYSMLSFGCRNIMCWVYAAYSDQFPALIDARGNRTAAWYDARTVFHEIRSLSDTYCRYRNLGAFTHNCTEKTPYLKMSSECKDFKSIPSITCADPLLIGCFAAKNGNGTAFTLVNMADLGTARSTLAKLKVPGTVTIYRRGIPHQSIADANDYHSFPLETGEGIFVTITPD